MTDTVSQALRAGAGLLTLVVPALAAPPRGLILTGAGVLLVGGQRPGPLPPVARRNARRRGPVIQCAIWPPGTVLLAAEGLLILGYLLLLDGLTCRLRGQLRFGVAGLIGAGVVLAALEVPSATSAWLVLAGLGAAVAAYVIAVPIRHTGDSRRG